MKSKPFKTIAFALGALAAAVGIGAFHGQTVSALTSDNVAWGINTDTNNQYFNYAFINGAAGTNLGGTYNPFVYDFGSG